MIDRIINLLLWNRKPEPPPVPCDMQNDIMGMHFEDIYEAEELAKHIRFSFIAKIGSQYWRVYPNQSPRLISRGQS